MALTRGGERIKQYLLTLLAQFGSRPTHLYVWVVSRHYFPVSFVDAFSRYIVHHRLLTELSGTAVSVELEAVLASCTGAKPRIVHDHGSECCNAELRAVIKAYNLIDIRTHARPLSPTASWMRWSGTVRRESKDYYGDNYLVAQHKVQPLVDQSNNVRLHAARGYCEPRELLFGNPSQPREDRAHKLLIQEARYSTRSAKFAK